MLEINNLRVSVGDAEILKGVSLTIGEGEVHAIMGPNGSGKSTLTNVIAGRPGYGVTGGDVMYDGESLLGMIPDERARRGVFLAFQYPVELPGVRNRQFLKAALDAVRAHQGREELSAREFDKIYRGAVKAVDIGAELMKRGVNEGFSGGEKKRSEMLQMTVLDPRLALLDETDSGLDIDALRLVAGIVNQRRRPDNATVLVTHYQRILSYITPDYVHVLLDGRIAQSGGRELALELEERGYEWLRQAAEGVGA